MNEFIVWDIEDQMFIPKEMFAIDGNCRGLSFDKAASDVVLTECFVEDCIKIEICQYIGKTDINGNKIYADCSIVDLTYKDFRYEEVQHYFGYFSEDNDKHCLGFTCIENGEKINFLMHIDYIMFIKIIDTIQENKLGLIK